MTEKQIKREYYKNLRLALTKEETAEKSRLIRENFLSSDIYRRSDTVMIYMPTGNEADIFSAFEYMLGDNKRVLIPAVTGDDMRAVVIDSSTVFKKGRFNIPEASEGEYADPAEIDLIAVPGIAFDRTGGRIGFGKGFYDRFLTGTGAVKAALCYNMQITDSVNAEPFDICMDYIFTETEMIKCIKRDFR